MKIYIHEWGISKCIIVLAENETKAKEMIWKKMAELGVAGVPITITDQIPVDQEAVIYSNPPF